MPDTRVTVSVHAADPLSRAGVVSHLLHQPAVEIVQDLSVAATRRAEQAERERGAESGGEAVGNVAIMPIDQFDEIAATELRRLVRGGEQRVVLIARDLREPELLAIVEYGVRAILWRHQTTPQRLLRAVQSAARGEGDLPPDLISRLLTQMGQQLRRSMESSAPVGVVPTLGMAPREVDVLRLVAEGQDTRQISEKLAYSERTVKNILHALMTRLQLHNRAHAVAYALREGYI